MRSLPDFIILLNQVRYLLSKNKDSSPHIPSHPSRYYVLIQAQTAGDNLGESFMTNEASLSGMRDEMTPPKCLWISLIGLEKISMKEEIEEAEDERNKIVEEQATKYDTLQNSKWGTYKHSDMKSKNGLKTIQSNVLKDKKGERDQRQESKQKSRRDKEKRIQEIESKEQRKKMKSRKRRFKQDNVQDDPTDIEQDTIAEIVLRQRLQMRTRNNYEILRQEVSIFIELED
ncbi:hypothetical protein Tco_0379552 [Tanacetum coccineum]